MRFCSIIGCQHGVFRTDKNTRLGYCQNHWKQHSTDIDKDSIYAKALKKRARENSNIKTTSKLRNLSYTSDEQRKAGKDKQTKSQLLKEADRLFSLFVRNRDADKNGNIQCVSCGKVYNIDQVDNGGNKVVQNLHFIDRGIYNLRFSEENCHAGCSYCNLDMSLNKNGFAYRRYLEFMTTTYGEEAIVEMTLAHRKINKLEIVQLKNIIEHYSQQ